LSTVSVKNGTAACNVFGQTKDEMRDDQEHMRAAISANKEMIDTDQEQIRAKMRAS
jgi:hypothetical protein